jgi:fructokinase
VADLKAPPAPVSDPPTAPLALGIDLGGTKIEAVLLDGAGQERWRRRVDTPAGDYLATLGAMVALVRQAQQAADGRGLTIGVGAPGSLSADGRVTNANSTCLNGQPMPHDLAQRLGQPVRWANDANCLALSEATDGAGAGAAVVFAAILGTGTGAGIAVHGRVLEGPNRLAGEWGHNPLPWPAAGEWPGPPCYCGKPGCIETWLSGPGIARDHRAHGGADLSAAQIAAGAAAGEAGCIATLDRHAERLARALASVINLLDPDVIVLGGGLSKLPHLYTQVPALWSRWAFGAGPRDPLRTRLVPSLHGDASGVRGASWLWRSG